MNISPFHGTIHWRVLALPLAWGAAWLGISMVSLHAQSNYTPYTFTAVVGSPGAPGSANGKGIAGMFSQPTGVTTIGGGGNVYVSDSGNETIRLIVPGDIVSTLAGTVGFSGSSDGLDSAAQFRNPVGIAEDTAGNLYVADALNNTIRKITPAGSVSTLAGSPGVSGSSNGQGSLARFANPNGIAVDGSGNLYVCDTGNSTIRKITPGGVVSTLAGTPGVVGTANGTGPTAQFDFPNGIAIDANNNLYVADTLNDTIREITPGGVVSTIAGIAQSPGFNDAAVGTSAQFNRPSGVAVDANGNIFVADTGNNTIREITPAGVVTTLAGVPGLSGNTDGTGSFAYFNQPFGIAVDANANLYVADSGNDTIREGSVASQLQGTTTDWSDNGADSSWNNLMNWTQGIPIASTNVLIENQPTNNTIGIDTGGPVTIPSLTFSSILSASVGVVAGGVETLQVNGPITNSSSQPEGFALPVIAGANAVYAGGNGGMNFAQLAVGTSNILISGAVAVSETLVFTINSTASYGTIGSINASGATININGTYTGNVGDTFQFTTGAFTGATIGTLPALSPGLAWNTSSFLTNGILSVISTATNFQTISAFTVPTQTYGEAPFSITPPTASSGLSVVLTVQSGPATISGSTLTLTGAGTVVLAADQSGNATYAAAPEVRTSFTVNQAPATLTLVGLTATYNGSPQGAAATTNPPGLSVSFTYNGSATPPTAVGSYTVVGTISNPNYQGSATGTLVISSGTAVATASLGTTVVATTGVTLNGEINAGGLSTTAAFQYGTDGTTFPFQVTATPGTITGSTNTAVSVQVTGLVAGTTYYYRLVATNSSGTTVSSTGQFNSVGSPIVVATGATLVGSNGAQLNATVNAEFSNTTVVFEYGTDGVNFPYTLPSPSPITGSTSTTVSASISNSANTPLVAGTTYYYQVVATNTAGTSTSAPLSFSLASLTALANQTTRQLPGEPTSTYYQGSLQVTLSTPATGAGAITGWRFVGEDLWRSSGTTVTGLVPGGSYYVEYEPVPGYTQPGTELVEINSGSPPALTILPTRKYTSTTSSGPLVSLQVDLVPGNIAGQWRFAGQNNTQWKNSGSGSIVMNLAPGAYSIECAQEPNQIAPPVTTVILPLYPTQSPNIVTLSYVGITPSLPNAPTPPTVLSFSTVTNSSTGQPYAYVGQIRSPGGAATGFVVSPNVVATAGHVVFDDDTETFYPPATLQWIFQRQAGTYEPQPQNPVGFYYLNGYDSARDTDIANDVATSQSPDVSTITSQAKDAAAMYFMGPAGGGGYSGYLVSDATTNPFLIPSATTPTAVSAILVGYPVDGISPSQQGQMFAAGPVSALFSQTTDIDQTTSERDQVYTTLNLIGAGGNSGGPLCVLYNGNYYPAAIYLGDLGDSSGSIYRSIDTDVANLFASAQISAGTGLNNTSGGVILYNTTLSGGTYLPLTLQVNFSPVAPPGAGWAMGTVSNHPVFPNGFPLKNIAPKSTPYTIYFQPVQGYVTPGPLSVPIYASESTTVNITYETITSQPYVNSISGATTTLTVDVAENAAPPVNNPATYQWQSTSDGVDYQSIAGATSPTYATSTLGTYRVIVTWGNDGSQISSPVSVTVPTFTLLEQLTGYLTTAEQNNSSYIDPAATPQHDGVSNLLKYVFDIDPTTPLDNQDRDALPVYAVSPSSGQPQYLTLTYRQFQNLSSSVTVTVQSSPDLVNWSTPPGSGISLTGTVQNGTYMDSVMEARVPITTTAKQFIRLNVHGP